MTQATPIDLDVVLDAAGGILIDDGFAAVSSESIAARSGVSVDELTALFPVPNDLLVAMLNREFTRMYASIFDSVERDPRGGLLSRLYTYILTSVYERPLAKMLFVIDREALNTIMRNSYSFSYSPGVGVRTELIEGLQAVGVVRSDIDAAALSSVLSVCSAGLALTAPHDDLGPVIDGLATLIARGADSEITDTSAGKAVFYDWATSLATERRKQPISE